MIPAPAIIRSERTITKRDRAEIIEWQGRRRITPGSHIADLVALGKSIALCNACNPRFDPRKHDYHVDRNLPRVRGKCDGCRQYRDPMVLYVPPALRSR